MSICWVNYARTGTWYWTGSAPSLQRAHFDSCRLQLWYALDHREATESPSTKPVHVLMLFLHGVWNFAVSDARNDGRFTHRLVAKVDFKLFGHWSLYKCGHKNSTDLSISRKLNLIHTRNMRDRQSRSCCRGVRLHIQTEDTARQNSADLQRAEGRWHYPVTWQMQPMSSHLPFVNRVHPVPGCRETHSTRIRRSTKHKSNTAIQIK